MATINKPAFLLLFTLSLLLLAHAKSPPEEEEEVSSEEALFNCFVKCGKQGPNQPELSECEQKCVEEYHQRKREEREETGGRGSGDVNNSNIEEAKADCERCRSVCGRTKWSRLENQCSRICKYRYPDLKRHRQEQEGGGNGNGDPGRERYRKCESKCRMHKPGEQRKYCQQKCEWEFRHEHGGGGGKRTRNGALVAPILDLVGF